MGSEGRKKKEGRKIPCCRLAREDTEIGARLYFGGETRTERNPFVSLAGPAVVMDDG